MVVQADTTVVRIDKMIDAVIVGDLVAIHRWNCRIAGVELLESPN